MSAVKRTVQIKPTRPAKPGLALHLIGDDVLAGGVGVWTILNRPRRREAIEFSGISGHTYTLPLLLDGMETQPGVDTVVEGQIRTLSAWASTPTQATNQPHVVRVTGPLKAPETLRWVIENLEWGAAIRNAQGRRVQQYVTVTLRQFLEPKIKRSPAKSARDRKK